LTETWFSNLNSCMPVKQAMQEIWTSGCCSWII